MALRSDSDPASTPEPTAVDTDATRSTGPGTTGPESTLSDAPNARILPELPVKRITAIVLAVVLLGSLLLPWWQADAVLRQVTDQLFGWQLLLVGFGIGEAAGHTGFTPLGNALIGAVTTLPLIVLAVLLIVRAVKPRALPGRVLVLWAVLELLAIGWLLILGWARLNATLGVHPATWGVLVAAMATLFTAIAFGNWWRGGERALYPQRGGLRLGAAEEPADGEELTTSELLRDLDEDAEAAPEADGREPGGSETPRVR